MTILSHPRTWPIWDAIFPPLCSLCHQPLERENLLFCSQCWADAPLANAQDLRTLKHVDMARAAFHFAPGNVIREAVHALKYSGLKRMAEVMVAHWILQLHPRFLESDLVWTAVPLHGFRFAARGFNQSLLLARELSRAVSHPRPVQLLRRIRHTPTQTARTYRERALNVKGAFRFRKKHEVPQSVLIIDDVITTGATMEECVRILKESGVEWVGVLSFALASHP